MLETRLAQEVEAYQLSRELGSQFHVEVVAALRRFLNRFHGVLDRLVELRCFLNRLNRVLDRLLVLRRFPNSGTTK